jgi:enoyl-CoA hydratase/carnithine racemase
LRFERRGVIGWCVINRPEARNALTAAMYFGIRRAVDLVNRDPELAGLVITGSGDVFAPGGEMSGRHDDDIAGVGGLLGNDVLPFHAIRNSAAPVVAAVNGICQGGGLTVAMVSDIAVASDRATFRAPELLRGVADAYYAVVMPAHIGVARTRELMFSGRRIDAREAVRIGLIARMVDHEDLEGAATNAMGEILRTAPAARLQFKRMVNAQYGLVDEVTFAQSVGSSEVIEGFRAFTEKRSPSWVPEPFRAERPQ